MYIGNVGTACEVLYRLLYGGDSLGKQPEERAIYPARDKAITTCPSTYEAVIDVEGEG